jgi:hypothetical protein
LNEPTIRTIIEVWGPLRLDGWNIMRYLATAVFSFLILTGCQYPLPGDPPSTERIVQRKPITLEEFKTLVRHDRHPDILYYSGSKDGFDHFVSRRITTSGGKPHQHETREDSIYWLSSSQAGFRHHLPFFGEEAELVSYSDYAPVDLFKSVVEGLDVTSLSAGVHRLPDDASSGTVDGTYLVFQTTGGDKVLFFTLFSYVDPIPARRGATVKRGWFYVTKNSTVNDLLRHGLATDGPSGITLAKSPAGFGSLRVFYGCYDSSRQPFFNGWFCFDDGTP